jgi:hypothetical protein
VGEWLKAASVPYTILRATQFFEFLGRIADSSTERDTGRRCTSSRRGIIRDQHIGEGRYEESERPAFPVPRVL